MVQYLSARAGFRNYRSRVIDAHSSRDNQGCQQPITAKAFGNTAIIHEYSIVVANVVIASSGIC
jgi:hypothetical protein